METTVKGARIKGGNSGVDFCRASRPSFFLFGDSITQYSSKLDPLGWGVLLADAYTSEFRSADIINRGFSGYNSRWALAILPQLIAQHGGAHPALVTIFFGSAQLPPRTHRAGRPSGLNGNGVVQSEQVPTTV
jgi:lysophospholipase L1-like esterase